MKKAKLILSLVVGLFMLAATFSYLQIKATQTIGDGNELVQASIIIKQPIEEREERSKDKIEGTIREPGMEALDEMVLKEIQEKYPDDKHIFAWQLMPLITFTDRNDVGDYINNIPIENTSDLNTEQQGSLRKAAVSALWPIFDNSPDTYLEIANEGREYISKETKDTILAMINDNDLAPNLSEVNQENAFKVFWEAVLPASIWAGASPDKCVFTTRTFKGTAADFREEALMSFRDKMPKCELGNFQVYHRVAKPRISAEELCAQEQKLTYAELLIYVKHQGKTSLTFPYLVQFWHDTSTNSWHPLEMGCGSDRDVGRLLF